MKTRKHRQWKDIPPRQRTRIILTGVVELVLTCVALWDLTHRPASQVKGKKLVWGIVSVMQPFGPIAYLLFGRKKEAAS